MWIQAYLFYTWGYNPMTHFVWGYNYSSFGHSFRVNSVSLWHEPNLFFFFWAQPYFYVLQECSTLLCFHYPTLERTSKDPCFFFWGMVIQKSKIWAMGVQRYITGSKRFYEEDLWTTYAKCVFPGDASRGHQVPGSGVWWNWHVGGKENFLRSSGWNPFYL